MSNRHLRWTFLIALLCAPVYPAVATEMPISASLTVVDYFRMLPSDRLEAPPASWLEIMRGGRNVIDTENGYLRCEGDGAQPAFEVALFRFHDNQPLLAVCQGELEGANSQYLEFYVAGPKGNLRKAPRSVFPIKDGSGTRFVLPRHGRTVLVRDKSGKNERKFTWDGEHFVAEK